MRYDIDLKNYFKRMTSRSLGLLLYRCVIPTASLTVLVGTLYAVQCVYDGNENVPSAGTERVDSIVCGNPCISRLYTVDLPAWRMHSAT